MRAGGAGGGVGGSGRAAHRGGAEAVGAAHWGSTARWQWRCLSWRENVSPGSWSRLGMRRCRGIVEPLRFILLLLISPRDVGANTAGAGGAAALCTWVDSWCGGWCAWWHGSCRGGGGCGGRCLWEVGCGRRCWEAGVELHDPQRCLSEFVVVLLVGNAVYQFGKLLPVL